MFATSCGHKDCGGLDERVLAVLFHKGVGHPSLLRAVEGHAFDCTTRETLAIHH